MCCPTEGSRTEGKSYSFAAPQDSPCGASPHCSNEAGQRILSCPWSTRARCVRLTAAACRTTGSRASRWNRRSLELIHASLSHIAASGYSFQAGLRLVPLSKSLHSVSDSIHAELKDSATPGGEWLSPNPPRWNSESSGRSGISLPNGLPALSENVESFRGEDEGWTTTLRFERDIDNEEEGEDECEEEGVMSGISDVGGSAVGMAPMTTILTKRTKPLTASIAGRGVGVLQKLGSGETDRKHRLRR